MMTSQPRKTETKRNKLTAAERLEEIEKKLAEVPELTFVQDNKEKYETYKVNMEKYKRALDNEFYYEATAIAYNVIEDRLRSFLYHCGLLENWDSECIYSGLDANFITSINAISDSRLNRIKMTSITNKIKVITCLLSWVNKKKDKTLNSIYQETLRDQITQRVDISGMQEVLTMLRQEKGWKTSRNDITHNLMNVNISSFNKNKKLIAEQGMIFAQYFALQVKRLKTDDAIRKACNLQDN